MGCTSLNDKLRSIHLTKGTSSKAYRLELENYTDIGSSNWVGEYFIKKSVSSENTLFEGNLDKSFNLKAFILFIPATVTAQLPVGSLILEVVVTNLLDYQREIRNRIVQVELIIGD